jgi:hypothetical protein
MLASRTISQYERLAAALTLEPLSAFSRGRHMSNLGLWIGFAFAALCVLGIFYAALASKTPADLSPRQLNLVILIAGGLVGWVVGMLITPVSPKDPVVFSDTGRALSTFVAGYLVAKIDRIFDIATRKDDNVNGLLVGRLLMFVSMFALGVLATFVWRSYVHLG